MTQRELPTPDHGPAPTNTASDTAQSTSGKLETHNIHVGYPNRPVIDDLSLDIPVGGFTAIVGPNGCGKSTLLRTLGRMLTPTAGTVLLDGRDIHRYPSKEVARRVGLLPQSPTPPAAITVGDLIARGRYPHQRLLAQWTDSDERAVRDALTQVGMLEHAHRLVDELSGGQRQRVWIGMALAQQTPTLLLDEPTTFLDICHQLDILDLIDRLVGHGRTVVAVLHELNTAARYADHMIAMCDGRIVATGAAEDVVTPSVLTAVFNLDAIVASDPEWGTPMVIPRRRGDGRREKGRRAMTQAPAPTPLPAGGFPHPPVMTAMTMAVPPHRRRVQTARRVTSPRIASLGQSPTPDAIRHFWDEVASAGTLLIEDASDGQCTYTFLYRGDPAVRRVGVVTNRVIDPVDYRQALMEHVPGTDIWWLSLRLGSGWRGSYSIAADRDGAATVPPTVLAEQQRRRERSLEMAHPEDHANLNAWYDLIAHTAPDPFCRVAAPRGMGSVAAGPDAPTSPDLLPAPPGRVIPVDPRLTGGRRLWWHIPAGPPPARWHTLVLLDGQHWRARTAVLDSWQAAGIIPPSATLLVDSGDMAARTADLTCSPRFIDTLLRALATVPADLGAPLSPKPAHTRIAGQSLGGLTALYAQCVAPDRFGISICQSGSFWWPNAAGGAEAEWLTTAIRDSGIQLGYVHLEAGLAEQPLLGPVRSLRHLLAGQTRQLCYREFDGGHDPACWEISLPTALRDSASSQ